MTGRHRLREVGNRRNGRLSGAFNSRNRQRASEDKAGVKGANFPGDNRGQKPSGGSSSAVLTAGHCRSRRTRASFLVFELRLKKMRNDQNGSFHMSFGDVRRRADRFCRQKGKFSYLKRSYTNRQNSLTGLENTGNFLELTRFSFNFHYRLRLLPETRAHSPFIYHSAYLPLSIYFYMDLLGSLCNSRIFFPFSQILKAQHFYPIKTISILLSWATFWRNWETVFPTTHMTLFYDTIWT